MKVTVKNAEITIPSINIDLSTRDLFDALSMSLGCPCKLYDNTDVFYCIKDDKLIRSEDVSHHGSPYYKDEVISEHKSDVELFEVMSKLRSIIIDMYSNRRNWLSMEDNIISFLYKNYKGKVSVRHVLANSIAYVYQTTMWHGEEQWLMNAYDIDRKDYRLFAVEDIIKFYGNNRKEEVNEVSEEWNFCSGCS